MSDEGQEVQTPESTEPTEQAQESRYDFVLDKYRADGRTEAEALELQAKSYTELSSKFGAFTGAPEAYEVGLSEELQDQGVMLDNEHPLVAELSEMAKSWNMSQDNFNEAMNLVGRYELMRELGEAERMEGEMKALGSDAHKRIEGINAWAEANLDARTIEGLQDAATSAAAVEAIEALIAKTRGAPVAAENAAPAPAISEAEVREMQFAVDAHGNRRINTDPEFKKEYQRKMGLLYGNEPHRQMIGG